MWDDIFVVRSVSDRRFQRQETILWQYRADNLLIVLLSHFPDIDVTIPGNNTQQGTIILKLTSGQAI